MTEEKKVVEKPKPPEGHYYKEGQDYKKPIGRPVKEKPKQEKKKMVPLTTEQKEKISVAVFVAGVIGIVFGITMLISLNLVRKKFFNLGRSVARQEILRLYSNEISTKVTVDVVDARTWSETIDSWMLMKEMYPLLDIRTPSEKLRYEIETANEKEDDKKASN